MAKRNVVDFKIINLSEEKFQELKEAGQIDPNALYATPDTTKERLDALETTKANDSSVVHLTGDETIDGVKYFLKQIVPKTSVLARKETDDSFVEIWSGSSYDRGAFFSANGKDAAEAPGCFVACANDGVTFKRLSGAPDGTLTWDEKEIIRLVSKNEPNSGTWYRKYSDGWVEQGGVVYGETTVTFPIAMKDAGYTITTSCDRYSANAGQAIAVTYNKTATSITIQPRWNGSGSSDIFVYWKIEGQGA